MSLTGDLREGWNFVRRRAWLWATSASAALAYLLFMGPVEVLLPLLVKNEVGGSATDLGLVFAAGGLGSVACAVVLGQGGLPRRDITFMYAVWTLATLAVAGYGLAGAVWQLMLVSVAFNALETAGTIVWATAKQRHVPAAMLGRVSSLDWLISIGLLPLSFALTGPVSAALGVRETLVARRHARRGRDARRAHGPRGPRRRRPGARGRGRAARRCALLSRSGDVARASRTLVGVTAPARTAASRAGLALYGAARAELLLRCERAVRRARRRGAACSPG